MIAATVYLKREEAWIVSVITGEATLSMPEIEVEISLADIYRDVELPPEDAAEA